MSMMIGRCALVGDPYKMTRAGNDVSFSIDLEPTTVGVTDQVKAQCQQLAGYVDNLDEPVIPVTWSEDSTLDGFYAVKSVSVPWAELELTTGWVETVQVTLTRIGVGYAAPQFETSVFSVVRPNIYSITAPAGIVLFGGSAGTETSLLYPVAFNGATPVGYVWTPDFTPAFSPDLRTMPAPFALSQYQYATPPATFYGGSCMIEVKYGSTWYPVIGRNIPKVIQGAWRISNGFFRFTSSATTGTNEATLLEIYANGWESQTVRHYNAAGGANIGYCAGTYALPLRVIRNSPEMVIVEVDGFQLSETFTIRRGEPFVTWSTISASGVSLGSNLGVKFASTTACTAVTAGMRATANDANGNRVVFATGEALTTDLVNGTIKANAPVGVATFMLGVEIDGSTAPSGRTAAAIVNQFFAPASLRQRVVVR